jgi:PHP domain-containing protein
MTINEKKRENKGTIPTGSSNKDFQNIEYFKKIMYRWDLHVHTSIGSPCAAYDPLQIPRYAKIENLNGVVITDHNFGWAEDNVTKSKYDKLLQSFEEFGIHAFLGLEVTCGDYDILVYPEDITAFINKLPGGVGRMDFQVEEIIEIADDLNALSVLAHPHSYPTSPKKMFHAIERYNGARGVFFNPYGIIEVAGSDAHFPWGVGKAYTVFPEEIHEIRDLIRLVKSGHCHPERKKVLND